ncbi:MAG: FdtA/QdtA family cupin domain-containing protein [Flavobacteriales bacterium]|nr:FdtA/QdtA family cupin domain-containing protein [Flavobacteriales bacterium]
MNRPKLINFNSIGSPELGFISVGEHPDVPFEIKRVYWTYYTPQSVERGSHAHKNLEQILIAVSGTIELTVETPDGNKYDFVLDSPDKGVHIPSMCWRTMRYSHNAVQMCLASKKYDKSDYIRDKDEFNELRAI